MRRSRYVNDPIGPATIYGAGRGAYAPGAAPIDGGERPNPAWNAPTVIEGRVFMTLGQERGYRSGVRRGA
jgi:hypothetical protein